MPRSFSGSSLRGQPLERRGSARARLLLPGPVGAFPPSLGREREIERGSAATVLGREIGAVAWAQTRAPATPANTIARGPDGKPDLSGIWQALNSAAWDLQDHSGALGWPPGQSVVEAAPSPICRRRRSSGRTSSTATPTIRLPGIPRATYMPFPFQIIQTTKAIVFSYEFTHARRHVFTDGSPHPMDFVTWRFEMGPPNALLRMGWRKSSVPPGTLVKIEGYRAKSGKNVANARP